MDITQLILDDHAEQRRLFAMVEQVDRDDTANLAAIWRRLATFLEVHAEAEEETLLSGAASPRQGCTRRGGAGG